MSFIQSTNFAVVPPQVHRASRMTQKSLDQVDSTYIIAIPAVGANPRTAWGDDEDQWLFQLHESIRNAVLLRYDHLEESERQLLRGVPPPANGPDAGDQTSLRTKLKAYNVEDWALRFLRAINKEHFVKSHRILFVCHSTGGIVLKEALSHANLHVSKTIKSACVLITFLATPHHGSIPLSDPQILPAIHETLRFEGVPGDGFMAQTEPFCDYLESLNQRFGYHCLGIPLWTYGELSKTDLSNNEQWLSALQLRMDVTAAAGSTDDSPILIVNSESSEIKNNEYHVPADEEEWEGLETDHAGIARLADSDKIIRDFINDVKDLLKPASLQEYGKHRELLQKIFKEVNVEQYTLSPKTFRGKTVNVEVAMVVKSLQAFIEQGRLRSETVSSSPINVSDRYVLDESPEGTTTDNSQNNEPSTMAADRSPVLHPANTTPKTAVKPSLGPNRAGWSFNPRPSTMPRRISTAFSQALIDEVESPPHQLTMMSVPEPSQVPHHLVGADIDAESGPEQPLNRSQTLPARPEQAQPTKSAYRRPKSIEWYHVSHGVLSWIPLVMDTLSSKKGSAKLHKQVLKDPVWLDHHNNPTQDAYHGHFVHPHAQALMPKGHHSTDEMLAPSSATSDPQFALYLPYLHWDTIDSMENRREVVKLRSYDKTKEDKVARGIRPVDDSILSSNSLEHKVMWQYLTSNIHCRRTLDQYGYPSLNTDERDMDQVLYKYTQSIREKSASKDKSRSSRRSKGTGPVEEPLPLAVLMVDTLWLWILDDQTIVTFAPRREDKGESEKFSSYQADPILAVLRSLTVEKNAEVNDCFDLAALLIFHCVEALLKGSVDSNLKVFRIFEGFLSDKIEDQTKSYKEFRKSQKSEKAQFDNGDDLNNLLELRDISDEIEILETLLKQQRQLVESIINIYEKKINVQQRGRVGIDLLKAAKYRLNVYIGQLDTLSKNSTKAQESYDKLLNLKEAHSGVLEARVASEQARIVNIFTIVTIIFSPLSFFAGIFGMNVVEWSGAPTNPSIMYTLKFTLGVSLPFTVILLLVAFNSKARKAYNHVSKLVLDYLSRGKFRLVDLGDEVKELKEEKREKKRRQRRIEDEEMENKGDVENGNS